MNPFNEAVKRLEEISSLIIEKENDKSLEKTLELLKVPDKILEVAVPVWRDNGDLNIYKGYRVQHNNILGPYKGGLRFHPQVDLDEVKALALWMTIKSSLVGIPYGGGKGGIAVDVKELSIGEVERMTRTYVGAIADNIGPQKDVPAPDVRTNPQTMAWFADEYGKLKGGNYLAVVTGKPVEFGGSLGRDTATAQGGFYVLETILEKIGRQNDNLNIIVQGFGNAGAHFARLASEAGHKVVAVSDSKGAIFNNKGLNIPSLIDYKNNTGSVSSFPGSKNISNDDLFFVDADVLVPAALENVITKDNAVKIKAKIILELANGPITVEADEILLSNNIIVIPDVLANAGGVMVSYFEWVQNLQNYYWDEKEVKRRLGQKIKSAAEDVWRVKNDYGIDTRRAAYVLAVGRIHKALLLRGGR